MLIDETRQGRSDPAIKAHLLNFVAGMGAYHDAVPDLLKPAAERTRLLFEKYPEIARGEMMEAEVRSDSPYVVAHAFGTPHQPVFAVVNLSPQSVQTTLWVPGRGGTVLYDRLDEQNLLLAGGLAWLDLPGYALMAYELR